MSRFSSLRSENLVKFFLVSVWFGLLSCFFLYLLPLFILDHLLFSFWPAIGISFAVSLAVFFAAVLFQSVEIDRLLSQSFTYTVLLIPILFLLVILNRFSMNNLALSSGYYLFFLLAVVFIFCPLRKLIQRTVNKIFFPDRLDYRSLLCNLSQRITSSLYLPDLVNVLVSELPECLQITRVGLMIMEEKRSRLYPEDLRFGSHLWSESRLVALLCERQHFFYCKSVDDDKELSDELMEIEAAGFSLVYGLKGISQFGGMLLLGPRKDGRLYSKRHIQIFSILANQVTIAVENALNYETLSESKDQLQLINTKLLQAEKMAALGEMTAILAHELKNPLGIIRSSAQFLVTGDRKPEMQQELLHYIVDEVDSLNLVINNLLGLARHKPPRFRKVDLKKEMISFVSMWRRCDDHNKEVEIDLAFPEHLPVLYADFRQLRQVLLNCVANSEEVMPDGGRITISVRELENERIEIQLTDTGPGLAEDDLKLVFKKFFTTKKKGVGLGLPVCRQIVRAHNGSIILINEKAGGASVIIHLPLRPLVSIGEDKRTNPAPASTELE